MHWFVPRWDRAIGQQLLVSITDLLARLERAAVKRLMGEVPIGLFLSGGLDSSLVAALTQPHLGPAKTFAVGLAGALDLEAARLAARALGTEHHERVYSVQDVDRSLEKIIWHLESYDPSLVRDAVPFYFLSELAAQHVRVVLTGDGADELFGGYHYFRRLQDPAALHRECVGLLFGLHSTNLQRLDRMTMAHGLEGRVPFLDTEFVAWVMGLAPELKMHGPDGREKQLLRAAASYLLPAGIAWRPKREGGCADALLRAYAELRVSDHDLCRARTSFPVDTPRNKEELLYRRIFAEHFPSEAARRTGQRRRPARAQVEGVSCSAE
jgi:asparagine synthase (glutamine-hydrolysing)